MELRVAGTLPHRLALPLSTMRTAEARLGSQEEGMVDTSMLLCRQRERVRVKT